MPPWSGEPFGWGRRECPEAPSAWGWAGALQTCPAPGSPRCPAPIMGPPNSLFLPLPLRHFTVIWEDRCHLQASHGARLALESAEQIRGEYGLRQSVPFLEQRKAPVSPPLQNACLTPQRPCSSPFEAWLRWHLPREAPKPRPARGRGKGGSRTHSSGTLWCHGAICPRPPAPAPRP